MAPEQPGDSGTPEHVLLLAESSLADGQLSAVVELLGSCVGDHPDNQRAWEMLALAYSKQGAWSDAESACRESVRLAPGSAKAHANLGMVLRKQGRADEAEERQQKALMLDGEYAFAEAELRKIDRDRARAPAPATSPRRSTYCGHCGGRILSTDNTCMACGAGVGPKRTQPDSESEVAQDTPPPDAHRSTWGAWSTPRNLVLQALLLLVIAAILVPLVLRLRQTQYVLGRSSWAPSGEPIIGAVVHGYWTGPGVHEEQAAVTDEYGLIEFVSPSFWGSPGVARLRFVPTTISYRGSVAPCQWAHTDEPSYCFSASEAAEVRTRWIEELAAGHDAGPS